MTALIMELVIPNKQEIIVSKTALATYGASGGLSSGESVRAGDLLYPLLLESSNDVANLISEQLPEDNFIIRMNEFASDLGMKDTSFEEASGLSKNNISTSKDLFTLSRYIYKDAPHILDVTRIRQFSLLRHTWTNSNYFLKFNSFLGGKNGYTDEARRTTVSIFELDMKRGEAIEKRNISIILLHTNTREQDVTRLLDFVKKSVSLEN
jgi:D-alanyl-D-alanine carboxypeptidase